MKRVHRKTSRTAEEKGRLKAIRDKFQAEHPSLDELVTSGDYTEPVKHGVTLDARHIAARLLLKSLFPHILALHSTQCRTFRMTDHRGCFGTAFFPKIQ